MVHGNVAGNINLDLQIIDICGDICDANAMQCNASVIHRLDGILPSVIRFQKKLQNRNVSRGRNK